MDAVFRHRVIPFLDDVSLLAAATVSRKHAWGGAARQHAARWRRPRRAAARALRAQLYRRARGRCLHPGCQGLAMIYVDFTDTARTVRARPVCCKHDYGGER